MVRGIGFVACVLCWVSLGSASANTTPPRVVIGGELLTFQVDPGLGVSQVNDGRVDIDVTGRVARLLLKTPEGHKFGVQGSLMAMNRDTCGAVIYTAIRQARVSAFSVDTQTLVIRDNTDSICPADATRSPTEVEVRRTMGNGAPSISKFGAERLSRQAPTFIIDGE